MAKYPDLIATVDTEKTGPVGDWPSLAAISDRFGATGRWIFRGLRNSAYGLETSLERAIIGLAVPTRVPTSDERRAALSRTYGTPPGRSVLDLEGGIIRRFRRQCQQYVSHSPSRPLELLALMQHYSAPTRLQDWTYSFHVAVFFAIEGTTPQRADACSVWALDAEWIRARFRTFCPDLYAILDEDRNLEIDPACFKRVFRQERAFVCPVNPYFLNDRLVIQQGVFLCPGAVCRTFEDNLAELQYDELAGVRTPNPDAATRLLRIDISTSPPTRAAILQRLTRMNISKATLFPGLQGFARSIEGALAFPDALESGEKYEADFPL